jgi:4-hydroxybenzoate polyprenyltransferase
VSQPVPLAEVVPLPVRRSPARAALVAMRPRQWTKNLLLLAGIVFAAELADPARWAKALVAFTAYCAASSAAYLVNDVRDARTDRLHPVKRRRPVARGELSARAALLLAGALLAVGVALAVWLGATSLALLAAFVSLQTAYTLVLKHVVLVDVITIAALFVLRAAAGAVAVDVRISPWLLACTFLLALLLALGKRRAELVLAAGTTSRRSLGGYSVPLLDQLLATTAGSAIASYVVYTLTARDSQALVVTVPLVVFGIFRYLLLVHRRGAGEEPDQVLVSDLPVLLTVMVWAVACAGILAR